MRAHRGTVVVLLGLLFVFLALCRPAAAALPAPDPDRSAATEKSVADGLYMTGYSASFGTNYSTVTVTVEELRNESYSRTTGTLRIEYWAAITPPATRGQTFRGYRLATFASIGALQPRSLYSNLVRSNAMTVPPDGTYTFVLILLEYNPARCSEVDGYCMVDNLTGSQRTFGNAPPPRYTLTVSTAGSGSGTVTSSPAGIRCPGTCAMDFDSGSNVSLSATPDGGSRFEGWGGSCSGSGGCSLSMTQGRTVTASFGRVTAASSNYSDLWWNAGESGWGLSITDHQTQMFAVWYTYRQDGSPTWFVMPGGTLREGRRIFSGDLYETSGPPYSQAFDPAQVRATWVGTASIDFAPAGFAPGTALFSYNVGAVSHTKQIQRQPFGDAAADWGADRTDIYWDPAESGWGITVTQHGNTAFAVWYTYDEQRRPLFVVMPSGRFSGPDTITGELYTTTGPYFGSATFDASRVRATAIGSGTLEFDPVQGQTLSLAKGFMPHHKKKGRFRPRVGGAVFNKWISPQPFGYSAPDTPPPACDVNYYEWGPCTNGMQYRQERSRVPPNCATNEIVTSQTCTNETQPQACAYQYTAWGPCQPGDYRSRTVVSSSPPGCTGTPETREYCPYAPPCNYTYGPWSACSGGLQTRALLGSSPAGCTGTPVLQQTCTSQLPPGFPTNVPLGTYRLDISVCATMVGCISSSQTLQNSDVQLFANQIVSILNSSVPPTPGCASVTQYSVFNGSSFTATLTITCSSGGATATSTVTIRATRI